VVLWQRVGNECSNIVDALYAPLAVRIILPSKSTQMSPSGTHVTFMVAHGIQIDIDNKHARTSREVQEPGTSFFLQLVHLKQSACHVFDKAFVTESCQLQTESQNKRHIPPWYICMQLVVHGHWHLKIHPILVTLSKVSQWQMWGEQPHSFIAR